MRTPGFIRDRHAHANVGVVPIGGEGLRTVEHPAIAALGRGCPRPAGIRTSIRLGQRPCADLLSLRQRNKILLLLRLRAKFEDVIAAERIVGGHDDSD
jgi:hypothetical protein